MTRRVAILPAPRATPFDIFVPLHIFWRCPGRAYSVRVCALGDPDLYERNGLRVSAEPNSDFLAQADIVIVPGIEAPLEIYPEPLLEALRGAHARGARVASICTGAFVLAAAGLLDGRRATTHWALADQLARDYPRVRVDPAPIFIDEGDIVTSAGVTAGIDLCLHLIRQDLGEAAAARVSRLIVASPHRRGDQAQFIERPLPNPRRQDLSRTRDWAMERLEQLELSVPDLAAHAGMSLRTFTRRFTAETGLSPLRWLLDQRIRRAALMLETTADSVEEISWRCGFATSLALRQHFKRQMKVTPTEYRRAFSRLRAAA